MITLGFAIQEVLSHPEYTRNLGWMLALTMVIGAQLNDGGKQVVSWTIAILVTGFLTQESRFVYWDVHGSTDFATLELALTLVGVTVCVLGLFMGWVLSYVARQRAHKQPVLPITGHHKKEG